VQVCDKGDAPARRSTAVLDPDSRQVRGSGPSIRGNGGTFAFAGEWRLDVPVQLGHGYLLREGDACGW
jgi:hypothetical protein